MPPALAARFTLGEQAALAIVAAEVRAGGDCRLCLDAIAARAGVSRSTVKNALRAAQAAGLITIQLRPVRGAKNRSNLIRVRSVEWLAWLERGPRGIGVKRVHPSDTQAFRKEESGDGSARKGRPRALHVGHKSMSLMR